MVKNRGDNDNDEDQDTNSIKAGVASCASWRGGAGWTSLCALAYFAYSAVCCPLTCALSLSLKLALNPGSGSGDQKKASRWKKLTETHGLCPPVLGSCHFVPLAVWHLHVPPSTLVHHFVLLPRNPSWVLKEPPMHVAACDGAIEMSVDTARQTQQLSRHRED